MYTLDFFLAVAHVVFSLETLAHISLAIFGVFVCWIVLKWRPSLLRALCLVYLLILCGSMDFFATNKIDYRGLYAQAEREGWNILFNHPISTPVVLIMCIACLISMYATKKVSDELWVELGMPERLSKFMRQKKQ